METKSVEENVMEEIEITVEHVKDDVKQKILEEISKYSPHSEVLTLSTLMAISQGVHICNISKPGLGKSRNTVELLKLLRIPFGLIAGHTTPKSFFMELQKDGIIIVDEGATILSDKNIINLLLNALWNGHVEWKNNKEILTHDFKGVIIFNVNQLSNTGLSEALKDRIFVNEVVLSNEQIKDKIMSSQTYKPNTEIWADIRERLGLTSFDMDLTLECPFNHRKTGLMGANTQNGQKNGDFEKLYYLIKCNENISSVREINKLKTIAKFSKMLINDLTLIDYFRKTDDVWKIMNTDIKDSDKIKMIAETKCITERHARRILNKLNC